MLSESMIAIPTVDLSPFFIDCEDDGKKEAIHSIQQACTDYGVFQIVNHGVPLDMMARALQLSSTFFAFPDEEKLKYSPGSAAPLSAGYIKQPEHSLYKNEYLLMFEPQSGFNVLPDNPPAFREVLEEIFLHFREKAELMENILNDCLGLPPNILKECNGDRSSDFMVALHYFPATDTENNGLTEHEDGNIFTFVIQDEVGGLEFKRDGKWIPVVPTPGAIVVNVGDVIQVLSNNRFRSATHRVVRSRGRSRRSFAFFYSIEDEKWIEPLAQLTKEIGETPKYRRFQFKEYKALRLKNHPDAVNITHFAIPTSMKDEVSMKLSTF